jgi:sulfide:quinone oxidoreductase
MFRALQAFQGGRVVISMGVPHKCPMAPLEITFMLHDYFKDRGIRDKVQLHYTYPIGRVHSLENVAKWAAPEFDRLGITYETLFNLKEVDGKAKMIKSEEGTETPYDLLVSIPAHRGMEVIEKNKLGAGGWIPTNRQQLNMEGRKNVFALGDTTNIPISKAGSTAHFEAEALGENIAAMVKLGAPVRDYDGKVFCFIEAGKDRATYAMFDYLNPPDPKPPTKAVHWFKMAYNKLYWISARGLL